MGDSAGHGGADGDAAGTECVRRSSDGAREGCRRRACLGRRDQPAQPRAQRRRRGRPQRAGRHREEDGDDDLRHRRRWLSAGPRSRPGYRPSAAARQPPTVGERERVAALHDRLKGFGTRIAGAHGESSVGAERLQPVAADGSRSARLPPRFRDARRSVSRPATASESAITVLFASPFDPLESKRINVLPRRSASNLHA